jgi:hypothetical protein
MLKAVARREVDMVATWSVDRLGRLLTDLLDLLRELHAKGVDLFFASAGARYVDATRPGDVSDDGGIGRVRTGDDPGTRARRARSRERTRHEPAVDG